MYIFKLPSHVKLRQVGHHVFNEAGELTVNDVNVDLLKNTLVRFYGCTVSKVSIEKPEALTSSLATQVTKSTTKSTTPVPR